MLGGGLAPQVGLPGGGAEMGAGVEVGGGVGTRPSGCCTHQAWTSGDTWGFSGVRNPAVAQAPCGWGVSCLRVTSTPGSSGPWDALCPSVSPLCSGGWDQGLSEAWDGVVPWQRSPGEA